MPNYEIKFKNGKELTVEADHVKHDYDRKIIFTKDVIGYKVFFGLFGTTTESHTVAIIYNGKEVDYIVDTDHEVSVIATVAQ